MPFFIRTVVSRKVVYTKYLVEAPDSESASEVALPDAFNAEADATVLGHVDNAYGEDKNLEDNCREEISAAYATRGEALVSEEAGVEY
jgi:hypothetical protein